MELVFDHDSDRLGEASRFLEPCFDVATIVAAEIWQRDQRLGAAAELVIVVAVEDAQALDSSPCISARLIGFSGCTVDTACL